LEAAQKMEWSIFCKDIILFLSHIYREGNFCASKFNVGALICVVIPSLGGT